jgi:cytochrome c oxidase cbb3-type subunit 1
MNPRSRNIPSEAESVDVIANAVWHSLAWLVVANVVGLLLAALLVFPNLNSLLGEWTYGRWMPLHLNLQLYGWCSLPLVAWLLKVYRVADTPARRWSRAALWAWSAALVVGAVSWLNGHVGGKIFLDWQGYARVLFPLATFCLWFVLAWALRSRWQAEKNNLCPFHIAKLLGLVVLFFVPATLHWAADPKIYPPVNPDTGGPTGASLLESTLGIVSVLLILPYGCNRQRRGGNDFIIGSWMVFVMEIGLSVSLGHTNASHRLPMQFLGLGSLLPWIFLVPAYFNSFVWPVNARRWLYALFFWWGILVTSAWAIFLPVLLDRFKFTDGLVGHSHMAMAGFVSSMNLLLLVTLLGEKSRVFGSRHAFFAWQIGVAGYVAAMFFAGFVEGKNPAFNFVPSATRDLIYLFRLGCGASMTVAAASWFWQIIKQQRSAEAPDRLKIVQHADAPEPSLVCHKFLPHDSEPMLGAANQQSEQCPSK